MMTIAQIATRIANANIAPKAFWAEACGGDMSPLRAEDVERVIAGMSPSLWCVIVDDANRGSRIASTHTTRADARERAAVTGFGARVRRMTQAQIDAHY